MSNMGSLVGIEPTGDDAVLKAHGRPVGDLQRVCIDEAGVAVDLRDAAFLGAIDEAGGHAIHDLGAAGAQLVEIDFRFAECQAEVGGVAGGMDGVGDMQQRFGGDAADMQAGAAELGPRVDERGLDAAVGSEECRSISARSAAKNDEIGAEGFSHGVKSLNYLVVSGKNRTSSRRLRALAMRRSMLKECPS